MNEKIKELALQAGGSHYPQVNPRQLELFARLIVEDCAEIALAGLAPAAAQAMRERYGIE